MTGPKDTICFTCGQAIQDPPRFNLLASGDYCPTCRERVLEAAPSLLPGGAGSPELAEEIEDDLQTSALEPAEQELEEDGDDYPGPPAA